MQAKVSTDSETRYWRVIANIHHSSQTTTDRATGLVLTQYH